MYKKISTPIFKKRRHRPNDTSRKRQPPIDDNSSSASAAVKRPGAPLTGHAKRRRQLLTAVTNNIRAFGYSHPEPIDDSNEDAIKAAMACIKACIADDDFFRNPEDLFLAVTSIVDTHSDDPAYTVLYTHFLRQYIGYLTKPVFFKNPVKNYNNVDLLLRLVETLTLRDRDLHSQLETSIKIVFKALITSQSTVQDCIITFDKSLVLLRQLPNPFSADLVKMFCVCVFDLISKHCKDTPKKDLLKTLELPDTAMVTFMRRLSSFIQSRLYHDRLITCPLPITAKLNLFVLLFEIVIDTDLAFIRDSIKADFKVLTLCDLHTDMDEREGSNFYGLMRHVLKAEQTQSLVNRPDLQTFKETLFALAKEYGHSGTAHYLLMVSELFQYQLNCLQTLDRDSLDSHISSLKHIYDKSDKRDTFIIPILYGLMHAYNRDSDKYSDFAQSCKGLFSAYYYLLSQPKPALRSFFDRVVTSK